MSISPTISIRPDSPLRPEVTALLERHVAMMRAASPPESTHVMEPGALATPEIAFFTLCEGEAVLGMGAIKRITAVHAEIKSMHIVSEARGRGLARILLDHLMAEARALGYTRLSLETGVEDVFAPARALYANAGFVVCLPFEGYTADPNSYFMSRVL